MSSTNDNDGSEVCNMLLPRFVTVLVGLPILLVSIHWGGIPLFIFFTGVVFLGLREFYHMAVHGGYDAQPHVGLIAGLTLYGCMIWSGSSFTFGLETLVIPVIFTLIIMTIFIREILGFSLRHSMLKISITFFGVFYVVWTLGHVCLLRELRPLGREYAYFLFGVIWVVDIMGYLIGKRFGRHK
ncbi:MAG: hypothetical protein GF384_08665, partial [Elusimicrobia bacterium]|nr:hypothetical protein [Elusimicrobiota bacterium]